MYHVLFHPLDSKAGDPIRELETRPFLELTQLRTAAV